MAAGAYLLRLWVSCFVSLAAELTAPLHVAAHAAGCSAEADRLSCVLGKLFAPSEEQAAAAEDLSKIPLLPHLPFPSVFEDLLTGDAALFNVPLSRDDTVAVLGSADGRLPLVVFLLGMGGSTIGVEKDPAQHARAVLALRRLRDFLHAYGTDLVDNNATCTDEAAKGGCAKDLTMAVRCSRSCYNRTQLTSLDWQGKTVSLVPQAPASANLSQVTLAILGQDRALDHARELVPLTAKLEAELGPGSTVWSLDHLLLQGATAQEAEPEEEPEEGKPAKKPGMLTVPAGGLVFLRRLHVAAPWSRGVPCQIYLRVPRPPATLRPTWPITADVATGLQRAATEELQRLGAMRLSGAVLSEMRFADATIAAYGAREPSARRLARAFGSPAAALGSGPDWCRCRPRPSQDQAVEVGALSLLAMFMLAVHSPGGQCHLPPCTAADKLVALATAELRKRLLAGHAESADIPPQVLRDLGCLRLSDQRTLLHAAVGRKDLQLARAALRSQGHGGLFCRDAEGRSALHHAAAGGQRATRLEGREANMSGALQPRVNASVATEWVLSQMQAHAADMVSATDAAGRTALFAAEDAETFRLLTQSPYSLDASALDISGRGLLWYAAASKRNELLAELLCEPGDRPERNESVNGTVPARPPGAKAKEALASRTPGSSPLLAALRQRAGLQCAGLDKAPEQAQQTLDLLAHCGGQHPDDLEGRSPWLADAKLP